MEEDCGCRRLECISKTSKAHEAAGIRLLLHSKAVSPVAKKKNLSKEMARQEVCSLTGSLRPFVLLCTYFSSSSILA
jgi:hypothetical protein